MKWKIFSRYIMNKKSTHNPTEVNNFASLANDWWNEDGAFKVLHKLNPVRLEYIHKFIPQKSQILDVGCGGGLVSIPLAKTNHQVTSLDPAKENIEIVKYVSEQKKVQKNVNFFNGTVEEFFKKHPKKLFDCVLAIEVIEHVENFDFFLETCAKILKDDGVLIVSTFNRTLKSFLQGILLAEHVFKWVPAGTHTWSKFLQPSEILEKININNNFIVEDIKGIKYNPFLDRWYLCNNTDVNYIMTLKKK